MEQLWYSLGAAYLLIMNLAGFLQMGADKHRARKGQYRIPERTLLLTAFFGGGIGSFLGMFAFHHKTKHKKFKITLPIAAVIAGILIIKLLMQYLSTNNV